MLSIGEQNENHSNRKWVRGLNCEAGKKHTDDHIRSIPTILTYKAVIFSAQDTVPSLSIGAHKGTDGSEREAFDVDLPVNRPDFYVSEACYKFSKTHIVGITFLGRLQRFPNIWAIPLFTRQGLTRS